MLYIEVDLCSLSSYCHSIDPRPSLMYFYNHMLIIGHLTFIGAAPMSSWWPINDIYCSYADMNCDYFNVLLL